MVSNDAVQSRSSSMLSIPSTTATSKKGLLKRQKPASILSKLTTPLSSLGSLRPPRNSRRALSEFYIRLDEPHRQYSPGDLVKGSVLVTVERDTKVTHIVVDLVGRVDLYGVANSGYTQGGKRKKVNYAAPVEFEGGVILCRDQQVLCGEGRLEIGVYEFKFVMELIGKGLPSSLDFEKGSISYNISATFTRPTAISPIKVCEHRLTLVELIDIAPLKPPKPRVITLDQTSKRSRLKSSHSSSDEKGVISQPNVPSVPPSPNASNHQICLENTLEKNVKVSKNAGVTATVELMKAGCLRGDFLPIRVTIAHNKTIKSMQGIIVTLIRQGRFDTVPLSTSFLNSKPSSSSLKKGLSLSSGGSTTTFRKDLSQTIMPLIIDPRTLTAVIKTSVRVPEDAFPTITSVPGGIVSFRYFVEVVVDLGGKLSGRDGFLDGVGMVTMPSSGTSDMKGDGKGKIISGTADPSSMMAIWGGQVVETDNIRRDVKNVVTCRFEVVIGTTDTASGKGRRQTLLLSEAPSMTDLQPENIEDNTENDDGEPSMDQRLGQPDQPQLPAAPPPATQYNPALAPIPEPPSNIELDEKTRFKLAERSLLPSEPPAFDIAGPSTVHSTSAVEELRSPIYTSANTTPSAPPMCDEHELYLAPGSSPSRAHLPHSPYQPSAPPMDNLGQSGSEPPQHSRTISSEDKQELERRRLMQAISEPPLDGPSMPPSNPPLAPLVESYFDAIDIQSPAPTAPILDEEGDRELPRYER